MKPLALRCFLWLFTRLCYRVTVLSPDNVPRTGGALLASNHVSFVDRLLGCASTQRFVPLLRSRCQVRARTHAYGVPFWSSFSGAGLDCSAQGW